MYFITTIDSKHDDTRCVGYFKHFEEAERAVLRNSFDICETCYDYVTIENIEEGIYQYDFQPKWYKWNNNKYDDFTALSALLESTGALYLPGAGYREVTSGKMKVKSINSNGNYWLSTYNSDIAAYCWFISGSTGIDAKIKARSLGLNVRLVR